MKEAPALCALLHRGHICSGEWSSPPISPASPSPIAVSMPLHIYFFLGGGEEATAVLHLEGHERRSRNHRRLRGGLLWTHNLAAFPHVHVLFPQLARLTPSLTKEAPPPDPPIDCQPWGTAAQAPETETSCVSRERGRKKGPCPVSWGEEGLRTPGPVLQGGSSWQRIAGGSSALSRSSRRCLAFSRAAAVGWTGSICRSG